MRWTDVVTPGTSERSARSSPEVVALGPRQSAIAWARSMAGNDVVFLDTETTGISARSSEIVDIAVVACDGTVLLDTLVQPAGTIPTEASRIHGIFDGDVEHAPTWTHIYPQVRAAIANRVVVVYNASFDRGMVAASSARLGLPEISSQWECAMVQYAAFRQQPSVYGRGFRLRKLELAVRSFGLTPGGHRAYGDAEACRRLVLAIAKEAE